MLTMLKRRRLLSLPLAGLAFAESALAQQKRSMADPLRVGVDKALVDSGLAQALVRAFGADTGIAVKLVPGTATQVLEALDRGELDAGLTNAPDAEIKLEKQTLVHDRQAIAGGEFVIIGPVVRGKGKAAEDVLGPAVGHDAAVALKNLAAAATGFTFVSPADGSGTHVAEQAAWRAAGAAPAAPWYVSLAPGDSLVAQARARGAYAIVELGAWLAQGGAPLAVRIDADPRMTEEVHVMRSFRVNHPAGKIFVAWIASGKGRRVAAGHRGYRAP